MWSAGAAGVMPHQSSAQSSAADFPTADGLTLEVANFIRDTGYRDIPDDVLDLGKKSILDGLGLALCGSMAETRVICGRYLQSLGIVGGNATVIGAARKALPRFAAWKN